MMIERKRKLTGETYIETILNFCQEHLIDFEDVVKLIHPSLKEKLETEAIELRLLKDNEIAASLEKFME